MSSDQLAHTLAELAWEKKGNDIVILNVKNLTDVTDYFVIISAESDLHAKAIADFLEDSMDNRRIKVWHKEGYKNFNWVLMDYIDVVVHIFRDHTRQYYDLEKLWGDARIIRVEDDAKNRIIFAEQN